MQTFIGWNKIIEIQNPDLVVKVEECEHNVLDFLIKNGLIEKKILTSDKLKLFNNKRYNKREHPNLNAKDYNSVSKELLGILNEWCITYGYGDFLSQLNKN